MWVRKRLDIGWPDLALGILRCSIPADRQGIERQVEAAWSDAEDTLVCLSVRSGFDLLLGSLRLAPGSEVLISAVTIRQMVDVVEHHGLVPVPIDLDVDRMAPRLDLMREAITPATRAILVAHLFGGRIPLEAILALAAEHRLLVVEDCAQAFAGKQYQGHPSADVSMFSFGSIKTATAMGGAVLRVGNPKLLERMRSKQAGYPVQTRRSYLRRLLKSAALKAISSRPVYAVLTCAFRATGCNQDRFINGSVRGFPGPRLVASIRRQPSAPLLAVLRRRLRTFDARRLEDRTKKGVWLVRRLRGHATCPGAALPKHTHWVFPILADAPDRVIRALRKSGLDATQGQSLSVVAPPAGRPELEPHAARATLSKIVFLPLYPEMPARVVRRMGRVLALDRGRPGPRSVDGDASLASEPISAS